MKGYIDRHGNNVPGVSILEAIASKPRKLKNLIKALTKLNLTIDPSVQISDKKSPWIK